MRNRGLVIGLSVVIAILGIVLVFFAFGTPQAPTSTVTPVNGQSGESADSGQRDDGSTTASGEVPPPDPSSPLAIEIPGCVCHSDDPKIVEEHANYRMNQCFGCHADGMPEMGG